MTILNKAEVFLIKKFNQRGTYKAFELPAIVDKLIATLEHAWKEEDLDTNIGEQKVGEYSFREAVDIIQDKLDRQSDKKPNQKNNLGNTLDFPVSIKKPKREDDCGW